MQRIVQKYSFNVLVKNWLEESRLQSEEIELCLAKEDSGQLLSQKKQKMFTSLLRPVVLYSEKEEFLRYGVDTQIICPDVRFPDICISGDVSLSSSVNKLHSGNQYLGSNYKITASPFTEPCARNCFKIRGIGSNHKDGEPLMFGDTVKIISYISSKELLVAASVPRLNTEKGLSDRPTLYLADGDEPDDPCRWTVTYWNAALRMAADGLPIPNGARVILKHTVTDRDATVETNHRMSTFFGREYEVSINSQKGCSVQNKNYNVWQFIFSRPKS